MQINKCVRVLPGHNIIADCVKAWEKNFASSFRDDFLLTYLQAMIYWHILNALWANHIIEKPTNYLVKKGVCYHIVMEVSVLRIPS